jgi:hypothetical protein
MLSLPAPEIEALIQGRIIVVITPMFIDSGFEFALYPTNDLKIALPVEEYYKSSFLSTAQTAIAQRNTKTFSTQAWVRCEDCQIIDDAKSLDALSKLTIWSIKALKEILAQRENIFLTYLRVYHLPQPIQIKKPQRTSFFTGLIPPVNVSDANPVLSDRHFAIRKTQLENLQPPLHPNLEELQAAIANLSTTSTKAKQQLDRDIKNFLGWAIQPKVSQVNPENWIYTIADIGNSSDGDTFEKVVRKSLIKLGFSNKNTNIKASLDPNSTGGAGGLDFYCEYPYQIVGECKATKTEKVPDGTAAQLVKLGHKHLQRQYNNCIKIIMAAGELTEDAQLTASGNEMNVIRPETLQRLVDLKAKHPGSIDLWKLKPCLEQQPFGEDADAKLNNYIDEIWQNIKLRIHLIELIKNADRQVAIEYISGAYDVSNPPKTIVDMKQMYETLIELSSPLTGYLGRIKGSDWKSDKFYFLRDLAI